MKTRGNAGEWGNMQSCEKMWKRQSCHQIGSAEKQDEIERICLCGGNLDKCGEIRIAHCLPRPRPALRTGIRSQAGAGAEPNPPRSRTTRSWPECRRGRSRRRMRVWGSDRSGSPAGGGGWAPRPCRWRQRRAHTSWGQLCDPERRFRYGVGPFGNKNSRSNQRYMPEGRFFWVSLDQIGGSWGCKSELPWGGGGRSVLENLLGAAQSPEKSCVSKSAGKRREHFIMGC